MKQRSLYRRGFTIVELAVVIAVIGILTTIITVGYGEVQKSARDQQRETHMTIFRSALEKFYDEHGVYPPGCYNLLETSTYSCFASEVNTSTHELSASATFDEVRQALPSLPDTFGDPRDEDKTHPLLYNKASSRHSGYLYVGGNTATLDSATAGGYSKTDLFPCYVSYYYSTYTDSREDETLSYIVGYFSEQDDAWVLYGGKNGRPFTIDGEASDGCIIRQ